MRNIVRRLIRLEVHAAAVTAEVIREPHILCFVDTDMRVVSELNMATGVWTHFEDKPAFTDEPGKATDIPT
jgi:hypothetical protein